LLQIFPSNRGVSGSAQAEVVVSRVARHAAAAYRRDVPSRYAQVLVLGWLLAASPLVAGCAGTQSQAASIANANQRLDASWRLQSFAPVVSLDLPLQAVLSAEIGTLVVTFNQGQFNAVGPGVNFTGHYQVQSASGDQLQLLLTDPQGVGYHFSAQFAGNLLHFESADKPWVGYGALERS
jgi:hypothetical protein